MKNECNGNCHNKKYKLIYDNGKKKPILLKEADLISEIIDYIVKTIEDQRMDYLSIWMNGRVLE